MGIFHSLCIITKTPKMKKILTFLAAATIFAACSNNDELDAKKDVVITDTSGMYKSNYSTDVSPVADNKEEVAPVAPTKVIRETRVVYVDRTPKARQQTVREATPVITEPVSNLPQVNTGTANTETKAGESSAGTVSTGPGNDGGGTGTSTSTSEPVKKKEGWSNAAKDAVIGGASGAVLGAIISKKKGKGAIIGGVIGAAGGYILGKKKDKADAAKDNIIPMYTSY